MKVAQIRLVDDEVVRTLRDALEMAERGELVAIAIATENRERFIATAWAGDDLDVHRMVGAMERLKLRLLDSAEET